MMKLTQNYEETNFPRKSKESQNDKSSKSSLRYPCNPIAICLLSAAILFPIPSLRHPFWDFISGALMNLNCPYYQ